MVRPLKIEGSHFQRVETRMWGGKSFSRLSRMPCSGQSLWLFLMTCPERHETGIFRLGLGAIMDHTGWKEEALREAFGEVFREGMAQFDEATHVLSLTNSVSRLQVQSPNVALSWGRHLASLPASTLVAARTKELKAFMKALGEAFIEAFTKGLGKGFPKDLGKPSSEAEAEAEAEASHHAPQQPDHPNQEREPWEEPPQSGEVTRTISGQGQKQKPKDRFGMKSLDQVSEKVAPKKPPGGGGKDTHPSEELEAFLADRFPEVSEVGRRSLLNAGLSLQGAREVDAVRHKTESDPATRPKDPGALWFTYLKSKAQGSAKAASLPDRNAERTGTERGTLP